VENPEVFVLTSNNRPGLIAFCLICLVGMSGALAIFFIGRDLMALNQKEVASALYMIFSIAVLLVWLRSLLNKRPALETSHKGLIVGSIFPCEIPWENIEEIKVGRAITGQKFKGEKAIFPASKMLVVVLLDSKRIYYKNAIHEALAPIFRLPAPANELKISLKMYTRLSYESIVGLLNKRWERAIHIDARSSDIV